MSKTDIKIRDIDSALGATTSPTLIAEYMTATTATGSPASGKFHSLIAGRAPLIDSSKKPSGKLGIERLPVLFDDFTLLAGESDTISVYRNKDDRISAGGFSRFTNDANNGLTIPAFSSTDAFVEVTFYGTGLNILVPQDGDREWLVDLDGVAQSNVFTNTTSTVLLGRNYNSNTVVNILSGLSLGVHTIRLKTVSNGFLYGLEILNESTTIGIPAGSLTSGGKRRTIASPTTTDLTTFDVSTQDGTSTITDATKGGCVVVYIDTDGTVKKSINYADTTQLNFASAAGHVNETEIARWNFREFGAGLADDFSTLTGSPSDRAFTLDDGTTTLVGHNYGSTLEAIAASAGSNDFVTLTFVGSGLDLITAETGTINAPYDVFIDGVSIGTPPTTQTIGHRPIVSGLPFGTHTMKLFNATGGETIKITDFVIYAPSKPALTTGQVELSCGYKTADFVANTTAGLETISTSVIRKSNTRESVYSGSWSISAVTPVSKLGGFEASTTTNTDYNEYTFFGTGFDFRFTGAVDTSSVVNVSVDGSVLNTTNFPGISGNNSTYGGGSIAFTDTTGVLNTQDAGTSLGAGLVVDGLPLDTHTVRFTHNDGANPHTFLAFDIITPYYAYKNDILNLSSDLVGSNALQSKVLIPGATDKKIIATEGICSDDVAEYQTEVIYLGGSWTSGDRTVCTRIGNTVTITVTQDSTHASSATPTSFVGIIPEIYRPAVTTYNTPFVNTGGTVRFIRIGVSAVGTLDFLYADVSLNTTAQTAPGQPMSITYNV